MQKIQSIRGMNDLLPDESRHWQFVEKILAQVAAQYGYQEIRTPIVEHTALFKRSIGEATDIVEKEMYTFEDKGGDYLTLRPENTASCIRAGIEHGLFHNQKQKLWYMGPMFRHERPQKGRYRQFHQFGCEAVGWTGPDVDAELIQLSARLWQRLGLKNLSLQINSIGTAEERKTYRQHLVDYFTQHVDQLDEDSKRRLSTNPLRIFDSKVQTTQQIAEQAPLLEDYLSEASTAHFKRLCELLDHADIEYSINPRLVRGLDYYSLTVFEWLTDQLGAQNAVLAGGRYDGLVEQLGGRSTPGIGFAMGIERLIELIKLAQTSTPESGLDFYIIIDQSPAALTKAMSIAEDLRDESKTVQIHFAAGKFKSQFKAADQLGAHHALILGEDELDKGSLTIKNLTDSAQYEVILYDNYIKDLLSICSK